MHGFSYRDTLGQTINIGDILEPILDEMKVDGYHKVVRVREPKSGLLAIISVHDMTLGPGVGGIRFRKYESFDEALDDVLRLSKGMTQKFAMIPRGTGGAKSVVILDPKTGKTPELLRAFGKAIDKLEGIYIGAEDSGCTPEDLAIINEETRHIIGLQNEKGAGNPAPFTAWGTFRGIEASLLKYFGSSSVKGRTVAIQGVGAVGEALAEHLYWHGASLIVSDINQEPLARLAKRFGATICHPNEILKAHCDVLAPCAFGGIINSETIPDLNCKIIAGCANNQLREATDADQLREKGILYAPDFVINVAGAINCISELSPQGYNPLEVQVDVDYIYDQLLNVYDLAEKNQCSTHQAAILLVEARLKAEAPVIC